MILSYGVLRREAVPAKPEIARLVIVIVIVIVIEDFPTHSPTTKNPVRSLRGCKIRVRPRRPDGSTAS